MPLLEDDYRPTSFYLNAHVHTIACSFRRVQNIRFKRVESSISTPDGDKFWFDRYSQGSNRVLIVSHGLEGHSRRPYVLGMVSRAIDEGWDVVAWNYRGCGGRANNKLQSYHSGSIDDLSLLIDHVDSMGYQNIALCGFSIGGNKTLLYLGRDRNQVNNKISAAVTFSVPCDLVSSSEVLAKPINRIYMKNFLASLYEKLKLKAEMFPGQVSLDGFKKIKTFADFDGRYTAPMNGFTSALDYWVQSSCLPHIPNINIPTLLVSSLDDPFLSERCFPFEEAKQNSSFFFRPLKKGGHVGFGAKGSTYYSETEGLRFLREYI